MFRVYLQHNQSKLTYVTYLNSREELGNFMLNLSIDYEVRDVMVVGHMELKDSLEFINKDSKIEFGEKEEG